MATPTTPKTTAYSSSQPVAQRPQAPRGRKMSEYGKQLAEKQKARREYGVSESQFRRYFARAAKSTIATDQALFTGLELRLDNIVFRAGLAKSRPMARQMVSHGLILVNGKRINMPSYSVNAGDTIQLRREGSFEYNKEAILPDWLTYNQKTKTAKVERLPKADDLVTDVNAQLIIEYYSR